MLVLALRLLTIAFFLVPAVSTAYEDDLFNNHDSNVPKVLSFSGSGMHAYTAVRIMEKMEKVLGHSITDHVDLIVGDGAGAMVAAALAHGYSASEIAQMFEEDSHNWLPKKLGKSSKRTMKRVTANFEKWANSKFSKFMSRAHTPFVITAYEDSGELIQFSSDADLSNFGHEVATSTAVKASMSDKNIYNPHTFKVGREGYAFSDNQHNPLDSGIEALKVAQNFVGANMPFHLISFDHPSINEEMIDRSGMKFARGSAITSFQFSNVKRLPSRYDNSVDSLTALGALADVKIAERITDVNQLVDSLRAHAAAV